MLIDYRLAKCKTNCVMIIFMSGYVSLASSLHQRQHAATCLTTTRYEWFYADTCLHTLQISSLNPCFDTCITIHILLASYIWAMLTITNRHIGGQPAKVCGGRRRPPNNSAYGILLPNFPFHLPLPLLLWCTSGLNVFCIQYINMCRSLVNSSTDITMRWEENLNAKATNNWLHAFPFSRH